MTAPAPVSPPSTPIDTLIAQITSRAEITAADVDALRRQVFCDGVVDRSEAEKVFLLERSCPVRDEAWNRFYVEALTDFFVWRSSPRGFIDEDNASFMIDNIMHDERIDGPTELELLVNVVHWAKAAPIKLKVFVLEAVRDSVMKAGDPVYGKERNAGVIDAVDVEIIRKMVYAVSSEGGITISHREAGLLFELHQLTAEANNDRAWKDLFVKGIANHLMFPREAPAAATPDDTMHRQTWLKEREGVRGMLARVGRAFGRGDISVGDSWSAFDPSGARAEREAEMRETERAREAAQRESIDSEEARWLVCKLSNTDPKHPNIQALLRFIRENAPSIDPSLDPIFSEAGI